LIRRVGGLHHEGLFFGLSKGRGVPLLMCAGTLVAQQPGVFKLKPGQARPITERKNGP